MRPILEVNPRHELVKSLAKLGDDDKAFKEDAARLLYDEVSRHDDLETLCGPPSLSVVPFRHVPEGVADLDEHNAQLVRALQEDGRVWIAPAKVDGAVCLRPCIVNYRTTDDDVRTLVALTREVGASLVRRA